MKTTLKDLLKRFDEGIAKDIQHAEDVEIWDAGERGGVDLKEELVGNVRDCLVQSIKDALEACRVENIDQVELPNGRIVDEAKFRLFGKHMMIKGYNQCTTQYDENVKKFMGEKEV